MPLPTDVVACISEVLTSVRGLEACFELALDQSRAESGAAIAERETLAKETAQQECLKAEKIVKELHDKLQAIDSKNGRLEKEVAASTEKANSTNKIVDELRRKVESQTVAMDEQDARLEDKCDEVGKLKDLLRGSQKNIVQLDDQLKRVHSQDNADLREERNEVAKLKDELKRLHTDFQHSEDKLKVARKHSETLESEVHSLRSQSKSERQASPSQRGHRPEATNRYRSRTPVQRSVPAVSAESVTEQRARSRDRRHEASTAGATATTASAVGAMKLRQREASDVKLRPRSRCPETTANSTREDSWHAGGSSWNHGGYQRERSRSPPPPHRRLSPPRKLCMQYIAGNCGQGNSCLKRHPVKDDLKDIRAQLKRTACLDGERCHRKDRDCLYGHDQDKALPNCRYDRNCTRANCHFAHPKGRKMDD